MGLDIKAFEKLTKIGRIPSNWNEKGEHEFPLRVEGDFKDRADNLTTGLYRFHGGQLSFSIGSCTNYNTWRDWLSKTMRGVPAKVIWTTKAGGPFYELIDFSDCDGVIGPKTSAKLFQDFTDFDKLAETGSQDAWDYENFRYFTCAFWMASKGGAVIFY